jgi:acetyltransferase-like isoleucine patch superfamily enzyme
MGSLRSYVAAGLARLRGALWLLHGGVHAQQVPRLLGPRCRLQVERGARLSIGANLRVDRDAEIVVYAGATLEIGDNVYIGHGSTIACAQEIRIGAETQVGDLVSIRDMNHRREPGVPLRLSGIVTSPIRIGTNCWLGSKVTVVAGAEIGDESTIAANAVVTSRIPAGTLAGGVPARTLACGSETP